MKYTCAALVFAATLLPVAGFTAKDELSPEDIKKNDAQYQCMQFVTKSLGDPRGVKFDFFGNFPTAKEKDGAYNVTVSTNEPAKHTTQCRVKEEAPGSWKLLSLQNVN